MNTIEPTAVKLEPLLRFPALKPYTGGVSRTTVHTWVKSGKFPAPRSLGDGRAVAWRESDLVRWQASRQASGGQE